jgi:hypothetical protein
VGVKPVNILSGKFLYKNSKKISFCSTKTFTEEHGSSGMTAAILLLAQEDFLSREHCIILCVTLFAYII